VVAPNDTMTLYS